MSLKALLLAYYLLIIIIIIMQCVNWFHHFIAPGLFPNIKITSQQREVKVIKNQTVNA